MRSTTGCISPARPGESVDQWWTRAEPLMDEWDERVGGEYRGGRPLDVWPAALRSELEASWWPIVTPGPSPAARRVQATIRVIRRDDVVRAARVR